MVFLKSARDQRYRIFLFPWKSLCPLTHSILENPLILGSGLIKKVSNRESLPRPEDFFEKCHGQTEKCHVEKKTLQLDIKF